MPMEIPAIAGAIPEFHGANNHATDQVIAIHVRNTVLFHHPCFFLGGVPSKGSVNVDLTPNLGGSGAVFDGLYAPKDGFGVRLTDGKGFHVSLLGKFTQFVYRAWQSPLFSPIQVEATALA